MTNQVSHPQSAVAIVGMAGRFPGAPDVDALWDRVRRGDDCLTDLVADELIAAGLPPTLVRSPDYVLRAGVLDDVAGFDAELFGIGPATPRSWTRNIATFSSAPGRRSSRRAASRSASTARSVCSPAAE